MSNYSLIFYFNSGLELNVENSTDLEKIQMQSIFPYLYILSNGKFPRKAWINVNITKIYSMNDRNRLQK